MRYLICLLLITSCAYQTHTVGGIASVVKQNKILAYRDYGSSNLVVTGKIIDIGVDSSLEKSIIKTVGGNDSVYIFKKNRETDLHPFIVLADEMLSYDVVVCFFTYADAAKATSYRVGDRASLYGKVYRFVTLDKRTVIVMDDCESQ